MLRESHLFACHKFLEDAGGQILIRMAKIDFNNVEEIGIICDQIHDYIMILKNHSQWEEEFVFKKFFTKEELSLFFGEHFSLEDSGKKIIDQLKTIINSDSQLRMLKGKQLYLDFRIFYASNLLHFHKEETAFLSLLQERATDEEIRAIDKPIYQNMSSNDIIEMLERLFPPINISEKKNIIEDLREFNAVNFVQALPKIRNLLTREEAIEVFGR